MAEARRTHQRHMAGLAMSMLLKPSRGVRDDIVRAGGTPKDHMKENVKQLRNQQKSNKQKKEQEAVPPPTPFKLKEFANVSPRISTRRPSAASSAQSSVEGTPDSSRPSTASTASSRALATKPKNYININYTRVHTASQKTSPSATPVATSEPKHKLGQIPKYLVDRKHEWARREEERIMALEQDKIPPGMALLPELDRIRTLNGLRSKREELLLELKRFPMVIELPSTKARMNKLENELRDLEQGIQIFSRAKVFVPKSSYEQIRMGAMTDR